MSTASPRTPSWTWFAAQSHAPSPTMPFLIYESENCELRFGANLVGGRSDGSVSLSPLSAIPPSALLIVRDSGTVIRRLPSRVEIRVDGEVLGSATRELLDGSLVEIGEIRLTFSRTVEQNAAAGAAAAPARAAATRLAREDDEEVDISPWLLRELRTGRTIPVPKAGMLIGRSEECRLVVAGRGVSRRHAMLEPSASGFAITDHSSNGTLVNGVPCRPRQSLARGDVVRVGEEDYRVEDDRAIGAPTSESQRPTELVATVNAPLAGDHPEPLASLEVARGRLRGTHYSIERAVCAIGSSRANDLRLDDTSVAPSHATLLLKAGTWYVTDLRSRHGTFVNGYRVAGERALSTGATLTVGNVVLVFRARAEKPVEEAIASIGFFRRVALLLGVA